MSNKWTDEQLLAINTKGSNLLVAAGAGAGKTAVLVERIIRKITSSSEPVDIDRLLVVTFTNAAASEMRERAGDAITKALDEDPDSKTLQRQLTLLPKASITTIHSFCLEVIRNNFHKIELDPAFRIADDTEMVLLRQEVIEELFEDMYALEENEGFTALVESYGGSRDDRQLVEIVLDVYEFSQSSPWPSAWLDEILGSYDTSEDYDFEASSWASMFLQNIRLELSGLCGNMERAVLIMEKAGGFDAYIETFRHEAEKLGEIAENNEIKYDEFEAELSGLNFERLRSVKGADETVKKTVTDIRKKVKDRKKELQNQIEGGNENVKRQINHLYPLMKSLVGLVKEFDIRIQAVKKEKGIVDFGDIEHFCLEILTENDENGN
jgi:ATP-dependent helicase/nuclease subunit A